MSDTPRTDNCIDIANDEGIEDVNAHELTNRVPRDKIICMSKKMKFIIQYRLKNYQYATDFMKKLKYDTWQTWKKYKTENQRDKAFEAVKDRDSMWEYRKWTIEKYEKQ